MKRWTAEIAYDGYEPYEVEIDELDELQDIMEKEDDWNQLTEIRITYNYKRA